jgi:nucleotide-binding universal stress UspA family protein
MYQRILVPYDDSKFSKKALDEAIKIAQMTNGDLYICTVVSVTNIVPPGSLLGLVKSASKAELHQKLLKSAKSYADRTLSSKISYCNSKHVRAYYKIIVEGSIVDEILKLAKKKSIDLIVIGSQGLHGIERLKSLGSVSRKVSELADCPVLIVR